MLSVTEQLVSNVTTQILICTYKFRTTSKTLLPLRIFISHNPRHHFTQPWDSTEPSLRNAIYGMMNRKEVAMD